MRMWMVDPTVLCRKHLLGEHVECHMFIGTLKRNKSIKKFIEYGLVETQNIKARHDALAKELTNRGYNHKSELIIDFPITPIGKIDVANSYRELQQRCPVCSGNIKEYKTKNKIDSDYNFYI